MISRYLFIGRRRINRRQGDRRAGYYVDRPRRDLIILALWIILLGALDAWFTCKLLKAGAMELNPMINFCLNLGWGYCLTVKFALMSGGLFLLLTHQNFFSMRRIVGGVSIFYSLLITYQVLLLFQI